MPAVAAVNSMDPSITARKGPELDSEGIQELQARMLSHALATRPDLMYPAATDTLADLCEVALQDALDSAAAEGAWDRGGHGMAQMLWNVDVMAATDCAMPLAVSSPAACSCEDAAL